MLKINEESEIKIFLQTVAFQFQLIFEIPKLSEIILTYF